MSVRQHSKLVAVAAGCLALGLAAPALGQSIHAAIYADNSDKVDGKHAVSSDASVQQRKGKLVATSRQTGRLPNNIITRAPDSERLNGYRHAALRSIPLLIQGAAVSGLGAQKSVQGVTFAATNDGTLRMGFIVPPDHKPDAPVYADIVYEENSAAACGWYAYAFGTEGPDNGTFYNGGWVVTGTSYEGLVGVPAGDDNAHTKTFRWPFNSKPGQMIQFALTRNGDAPDDDCGAITIYGAQIRY